MRVYTTGGFAEAKDSFQKAYAAYHAHLDDNQVSVEEELHGPHAQAESEALYRVLGYPATTTTEIAAKLAFMREKGVETWTGYPEWMAQIERELIELQRPCVSPEMHVAFDEWRTAHLLWLNQWSDEFTERHTSAFLNMMQLPCCTPGDFIVKVYANQLGEHGATSYGPNHPDNEPGCFPFELDDSALGEGLGSHDAAAEEAYARDIRDCDLGRCLLALGRVDFDAEAWLAAAHRAQMDVYVAIHADGNRFLCHGEPDHPLGSQWRRRFDMCLELTGKDLGVVGTDRRRAIVDHMISHHPELVMDCRDAGAAA